jgi:membrane-bound inhibitor of C-type lysozyme
MIVLGTAVAWSLAGLAPVLAQQDTQVQSYHCADGTNFIVGFFPYDKRAYLEIDGGAVTLRKRPSVSGTRYAGHGVTLKIANTGAVTVKHAKRPFTVCDLEKRE